MNASASARLKTAKARALSSRFDGTASATARASRWYCATGLSVANLAMHSCSAVRTELFVPPIAFNSARSCANICPKMEGGGSGLNWVALDIVQGVTVVQDRKGLAPVRGSGCQYPRPVGGV